LITWALWLAMTDFLAVVPCSVPSAPTEDCDERCRAPIEAVERRFENMNGLHPWIPYSASRARCRIQIAGNHYLFRPDKEYSLYVAGLAGIHHDDQIGPLYICERQRP
jgi:hypothetical protein